MRLRSAPGTQVWTKWNIKTNLVGLWKYPGNFRTLVACNIRQSTRQDGVSVTLLRCRRAFSRNRFHREISPAPGKLISVCRAARAGPGSVIKTKSTGAFLRPHHGDGQDCLFLSSGRQSSGLVSSPEQDERKV